MIELNFNHLVQGTIHSISEFQFDQAEAIESISSEGDIDGEGEGIELEVIPESPKSSKPDLHEWDRESVAELEVFSFQLAQTLFVQL